MAIFQPAYRDHWPSNENAIGSVCRSPESINVGAGSIREQLINMLAVRLARRVCGPAFPFCHRIEIDWLGYPVRVGLVLTATPHRKYGKTFHVASAMSVRRDRVSFRFRGGSARLLKYHGLARVPRKPQSESESTNLWSAKLTRHEEAVELPSSCASYLVTIAGKRNATAIIFQRSRALSGLMTTGYRRVS